MAAHSRSAQRCAALRAQRSTFCCVKRAEENEINHIQARERRREERRGEERERASQRRKVSGARLARSRSAAAVQWVKSSVLNDAHIDKWMAHPLLLLRLCLLSGHELNFAKCYMIFYTPLSYLTR